MMLQKTLHTGWLVLLLLVGAVQASAAYPGAPRPVHEAGAAHPAADAAAGYLGDHTEAGEALPARPLVVLPALDLPLQGPQRTGSALYNSNRPFRALLFLQAGSHPISRREGTATPLYRLLQVFRC